MSENVPDPVKRSKTRAVGHAGYQKGEETRHRILDAALRAFGEASYKAVTTRQISEASGVSLPTLQYYFDSKEGLYRACAEAIVKRRRRQTAVAVGKAIRALNEGCSAETARAHLKTIIEDVARLIVESAEAARWSQFVARELRDPGPAFEILYERLWRPGVEVTARLIARILGIPESDPAARIHALLLIASLMAFQSARNVSLRTMRWSTIGPEEMAMVLSCLDAQIDAIGSQPSPGREND
jgi:TetR/AcrR family transcriptional regulator, regulator of cefoperazone and chloramphenicol sensitivity